MAFSVCCHGLLVDPRVFVLRTVSARPLQKIFVQQSRPSNAGSRATLWRLVRPPLPPVSPWQWLSFKNKLFMLHRRRNSRPATLTACPWAGHPRPSSPLTAPEKGFQWESPRWLENSASRCVLFPNLSGKPFRHTCQAAISNTPTSMRWVCTGNMVPAAGRSELERAAPPQRVGCRHQARPVLAVLALRRGRRALGWYQLQRTGCAVRCLESLHKRERERARESERVDDDDPDEI